VTVSRPVALSELELTPEVGYAGDVWRRLWRSNLARVGLCVVGFFVALAVVAPYVTPYSPIDQTLVDRLKPPTAAQIQA